MPVHMARGGAAAAAGAAANRSRSGTSSSRGSPNSGPPAGGIHLARAQADAIRAEGQAAAAAAAAGADAGDGAAAQEGTEHDQMSKTIASKIKAWDRSVTAAHTQDPCLAKPKVNWREGFTERTSFQLAIGSVVVMNAIVLGVEADYGSVFVTFFQVCEYSFCLVFTMELLLHFLCEGPREYFSDAMNWFDFVLVMMSISDVCLAAAGLDVGSMKELAVLRMLRLIRLARLVRLFRIFRELTLLISGLLSSVKTLSWALLFLGITVYIFAIFARLVIGKANDCTEEDEPTCDARSAPRYQFNPEIGDQNSIFGTVEKTMLSLFVCLTEGCGFDIMRPVSHETPILTVFWIFFVCFTTFGVLNLICGIICEQSLKSASQNEAALLEARDQDRTKTLSSMVEIFEAMDTNDSGTISHAEFLDAIRTNKQVAAAFMDLGLQHEENLFEKLDANKTSDVTFDQFFDGLFLIMKGHETARAKDLVRTHLLCQTLSKKAKVVSEEMSGLKRKHLLRVSDARALREASEVVLQNMLYLNGRLDGLADSLQAIRTAIDAPRLKPHFAENVHDNLLPPAACLAVNPRLDDAPVGRKGAGMAEISGQPHVPQPPSSLAESAAGCVSQAACGAGSAPCAGQARMCAL